MSNGTMTADQRMNIEKFRFYLMWGAWPDDKNVKSSYKNDKYILSVENADHVRLAVNKAYIDMSPRTISGFGDQKLDEKDKTDPLENNEKRRDVKEAKLNDIKNNLAEGIAETFNPNNTFDHEKLCNAFLRRFNCLLETLENDIDEIEYGKAQKIVNMTYKYLLLFDDASEHDHMEVFEKCDMPIDSYIIRYYNEKISQEKIMQSWSNMGDKKYKGIKDEIKNTLVDQNSPIFAEFEWWEEMKKEEDQKEKEKKGK